MLITSWRSVLHVPNLNTIKETACIRKIWKNIIMFGRPLLLLACVNFWVYDWDHSSSNSTCFNVKNTFSYVFLYLPSSLLAYLLFPLLYVQYLLSFPFSIAIFKKIVAYHLQGVAIINRSVCWLMVAFLETDTFSKLPLLSELVDDVHAAVAVYRRRADFKLACPRTGTVAPACEFMKPILLLFLTSSRLHPCEDLYFSHLLVSPLFSPSLPYTYLAFAFTFPSMSLPVS